MNKYHERKKEIIQSSINVHHTVAELKVEQKSKVAAFVATTSPVVRSQLEKEVEELESRIKSAGSESQKIDVTEEDIGRFKGYGKYCLEHLPELLLNPENPTQQLNLFSLIFDELPSYMDIVNGTAKMAWIFDISSVNPQKTDLVRARGLGWNAIEDTIKRWLAIIGGLSSAPNRQGIG